VTVSPPRSPRVPPQLGAQDRLVDDVSDSLLSGDFSEQGHEDAVIERSRIVRAQFTGATLCRLRLMDVVVEGCDFSGTDLDQSSATRVEFRDCRMSGAILTRSSFEDVLFTGCRLDGANFRMSETKGVHFEDVDLRRSDFSNANGTGTRFFDCDLTGADFTKVVASGVRFHGSTLLDLKGAQYLGGAVIESPQVLPVALGVLAALGIRIDDEREPVDVPVRRGRSLNR
jgi:uncharacterized protein YjbI with pentapeptide repeats